MTAVRNLLRIPVARVALTVSIACLHSSTVSYPLGGMATTLPSKSFTRHR